METIEQGECSPMMQTLEWDKCSKDMNLQTRQILQGWQHIWRGECSKDVNAQTNGRSFLWISAPKDRNTNEGKMWGEEIFGILVVSVIDWAQKGAKFESY